LRGSSLGGPRRICLLQGKLYRDFWIGRVSENTHSTAYCADVDPYEPCMYEWSSKPFGRTVSVRIMRCGSTTPKSAVGTPVNKGKKG
jgi:hypothetical protein